MLLFEFGLIVNEYDVDVDDEAFIVGAILLGSLCFSRNLGETAIGIDAVDWALLTDDEYFYF